MVSSWPEEPASFCRQPLEVSIFSSLLVVNFVIVLNFLSFLFCLAFFVALNSRVFICYSIYKAKATLTMDQRGPEFAPLESTGGQRGAARGGKKRGFAGLGGFAGFATASPLLPPFSPATALAVGCRPFSPPHDSAARLLLLLTRVPWILHAIAAVARSISSPSPPVVTAGDSCGYRLRATAIAVSTLCLHPHALRPAGFTTSTAAFVLFSSHISPLRPAALAASPPRPVATATLGRRPHRWLTYGFHDSCCALRVVCWPSRR
ncbi:hypothetical protein ZIOFF_013869 [Zingiber officinale]|uniref:Uncharacterized protein n=1 Tax=Zingiber officinale TaxID=94328 RepID=A0A8J5LP45_ZINOF|nr:hypothetical protein ZIOFF_013869 [Zingiber officinale]